ncbi:MAG: class I SAM-dependent methyltransferase [Thermoleophilia bacterium]
METKTDLLALSSDLYSRNLIISEGVKKFKKDRGLDKVKILDIGGRNGQLAIFLDPQDDLTILDKRPGEEENLIVGDATDMSFEDGYFDVVTSGDVYEHIPESSRQQFIREALRVTNGLLIVAAPFAEGQNEHLEKTVNDYFKRLIGRDHEWLAEHIENGLPSVEDLERFLEGEGADFSLCRSNSADNWMLLLSLSFYFARFPQVNDDALKRFFRQYNENITSLEDPDDDFYRRIYFITRDGGFDFFFPYHFDRASKIDLMREAFEMITETGNAALAEVEFLHGHIREQTDAIHTLEDQLRASYQSIQEARDSNIRLENVILAMRASKVWKAGEALAKIRSLVKRRLRR